MAENDEVMENDPTWGYREVIEALKQFPDGATVRQICDVTKRNYFSCRRYMELAVERNDCRRLSFRNGGKILYRVDYVGKMPALRTLGENPPIPVAKLISSNLKDPNTLHVVKLLKRFPLYLASMARLAALSRSDNMRDRPDQEHWQELRMNLVHLQQRAFLVADHCNTLLNTPGFWNNKTAWDLWFTDETTPYMPEQALEHYAALNNLLKDQ